MDDIAKIDAQQGKPVLRVLAASALRGVLMEAAERHSRDSGAGFELHFGTSGAIDKRVRGGEQFDLVASARDALAGLARDRLVSGELLDFGVSKLALGVRAGERAPDISSAEKFKSALLAARAISRGDPAGGGTAGNHLVKVFAQLGVTEEVGGKSILRAGGFAVMKEVAEGRADFGLTQSTEIPAVEGVAVGAYLPDDVQLTTIYAIAQGGEAQPGAGDFQLYLGSDGVKKMAAAAGFAAA